MAFTFNPPVSLGAYTLRDSDPNGKWFLWERREDWQRTSGGQLDERDVAILDRALALEGGAMLVTLAIWVIGLQETFRSTGAVPLVWLYLVMWSMLLLKALVLPVGVLIGTNRRFAKLLQPIVQVVAAIPATALFPVLLLALLQTAYGLNISAIMR